MKKSLLTSIFVMVATAASAQIAVVDTQYVFENSDLTKQVKAQMLEMTKQAKEKIQAEEDALAKKQDKLIAKKAVMNKDLYAQKEEELRQEIIKFKNNIKESQRELTLKNREKKQEIAEKISKAVEKIAKEKKYTAVIAKTFMLYNTEKVEITNEVLKEVNKK